MTNAKKATKPDLNRRDALKRLGLAVGAAYMTPALLSLSNAHASSGSSGGSSSGSSGASNSGTSGASNSGTSMASATSSVSDPSSTDATSTSASTCLLGIIGNGC